LPTSTNVTGVIVADDDPLIRSILRARFEALDLNVFLVPDGLEAVAYASRIQAALIILDLKMPRLNGLLACERIRELPGNEHTPIAILTSMQGKEAEAAAARVGATTYFTKPFRPALLLHAVSHYLPISEAAREMLRLGADEANRFDRPGPRPAGGTAVKHIGPEGPLDRGKTILDVLRG
jgi:CheY-like chemotaxis protein